MGRYCLNKIIEDYLLKNNFYGSIKVLKDNKEFFSFSNGYANINWNIKNEISTKFGLASVTKTFTSIGIFLLMQDNKLNITDKIQTYLGSFNFNYPNNLTIKHLLSHTSCIPEYYDFEGLQYEDDEQLTQALEKFFHHGASTSMVHLIDYIPYIKDKKYPEKFIENNFTYSNSNYILLGLIIEKITGKSFQDFVTDNILRKFGLNESGFFYFNEPNVAFADGYYPLRKKGKVVGWKKNIFVLPNVGSSDGGMYSSVGDLIKFHQLLRNGEILKNSYQKLFFKPEILAEENEEYRWEYGYGLSFMIEKKTGSLIRYGHAGGDFGVSTGYYYYPQEKLDICILSNYSQPNDDWMIDLNFHKLFF